MKPTPTLDDLCAAMARFLTCLERADLDTLVELHDRVSSVPQFRRAQDGYLAQVIQAEIERKARRSGRNEHSVKGRA